MRTTTIDNTADTLDSRDIIARIAELRGERDSFTATCVVCDGAGEVAPGHDGAPYATCGPCDGFGRVDAPAQWESENEEDAAELAALEDVQDQATQYVTDWTHGATLIRDGYFTDYARELLEDCGDIPKGMPWYVVVDWDATAEHIRTDYTEVDFDGVTYWVR